jgi:hypothetical protein
MWGGRRAGPTCALPVAAGELAFGAVGFVSYRYMFRNALYDGESPGGLLS